MRAAWSVSCPGSPQPTWGHESFYPPVVNPHNDLISGTGVEIALGRSVRSGQLGTGRMGGRVCVCGRRRGGTRDIENGSP